MPKENYQLQICRCCLQEIPDKFASTYLLQKPEQDIQLGTEHLAKSYLECYYFCMAKDFENLPPKESLNDYGYICLKCKEILMEATRFIVSSAVNESFLLSMVAKSTGVDVIGPFAVEIESQNSREDELMRDNELEFEMIEEYLESSENESSTFMDKEKALDLQLGQVPPMIKSTHSVLPNEQLTSRQNDGNSLETFEEVILEAANNNNCVLEEASLRDCEPPNVSKWQVEQYLCFNCELCTKVFNLESQLYEHYNYEHDEETFGFPCDICQRRHVSFKALRYHRHQLHKNYKYIDCATCGKAVLAKCYKRHKAQHVFRCDKCEETYNSKLELHKHIRKTHEYVREKRYDCQECNRHFFSQNNLKLHSITHQNNINSSQQGYVFNCEICSQSFTRPMFLKQHLDSHRTDIMKCPHCSKEFTRLTDIEAHMRLHAKDSQQFERGVQLNDGLERRRSANYHCPFCDKKFLSSFNLRQHSYAHSGWPVTCKLCQEGFSSVYIMRRHLKAVHCEQFPNRYSDAIADTLYERHRIKEIFPRANNIL